MISHIPNRLLDGRCSFVLLHTALVLVPAAQAADTIAPTITSGLIASVNSPSRVTLFWNPAIDAGGSNLAGYRVYRDGAFVGVTSTTSLTDSGVNPNTRYCYSVAAYDGAGNTAPASAKACATTQPVVGEEFFGPFASWADLKADYGAAGNGSADDTAALQAALNDLGTTGKPSVLFIPAGTYRITQTLTLRSRQYVSLLGEHPDSTKLKWDGATGGVLLRLDGVAYSRFDRLSFDGAGQAAVLIDQSLSGYSQGQFFDTGNEYADNVFQDAGIGIRAGNADLGAAESSVLRCRFLRHSTAGIILKNFNALDWFIWHCTFDDNYVGVSNNPGAGNFHIYGSLFRRSTNADIDIGNLGIFAFRFNTSIGSRRFFNVPLTYNNGSPITFQGNTIADTTDDTAINLGTIGPILLVDNIIASRANAAGPAIKHNSYDAPDMIAVSNTFTVSNPLSITGALGAPRSLELDNQIVTRSSLAITAPTLPGTPPNYNRPVFEIAAGASAAAIQAAINQAAALTGQRPVVHLAQGSYTFTTTLVIPANADLQLIGDGDKTELIWGGPVGTTPLLRLAGPARAILRDFMIKTYGKAAGILMDNADQSGARVYLQQAHLSRGLTANLLADQLNRATIEAHNFFSSQTAIAPASAGTGLKVTGGANPQGGKVSVFAGASSDNYLSFDVTNGGRLLVNEVWYEGHTLTTFAHVAGNSTFTAQGCRIAMPPSGTSVRLDDLSGWATLLTSQPDAPVVLSGSGNGAAWVAGNESHGASNYFTDNSSALGLFTFNRWYDTSYGSRAVANQGFPPSPTFVRTMLAHMRSEKPLSQPATLPAGVTDARVYRVGVDGATTCLRVAP